MFLSGEKRKEFQREGECVCTGGIWGGGIYKSESVYRVEFEGHVAERGDGTVEDKCTRGEMLSSWSAVPQFGLIFSPVFGLLI